MNRHAPAAIPRFRRLAEAVQAEGCRLFGRIVRVGRHIDGNVARMPPRSAGDTSWSSAAPPPHPVTEAEIAMAVQDHAGVAGTRMEAGLEGNALGMALGHLVQQCLAPASNRREDGHGGSAGNRLRFALETLRAAPGPDRAPGIRIGADEFPPGGLTLADMTDIVRRLCAAVQAGFVNVPHSARHGGHPVSPRMADATLWPEGLQPPTRGTGGAQDGARHRPAVLTVCRHRTVDARNSRLPWGVGD